MSFWTEHLTPISLLMLLTMYCFEWRENVKLRRKLLQLEVRQFPRCNFCENSQQDCEAFVGGSRDGVDSYICDRCAAVVLEIRDDYRAEALKDSEQPKG